MRKMTEFVMPIKVFAAMMFFGLIILYVIGGMLHNVLTGEVIEYAVPFIFVFQSAGLSIAIAAIWVLFFNESIIKKWRFFPRYILFALSTMAVLAISFFTFLNVPSEWSTSLLIATLTIFIGTTIFLSINELYYRKTGERYVEILNVYKKGLEQ